MASDYPFGKSFSFLANLKTMKSNIHIKQTRLLIICMCKHRLLNDLDPSCVYTRTMARLVDDV